MTRDTRTLPDVPTLQRAAHLEKHAARKLEPTLADTQFVIGTFT